MEDLTGKQFGPYQIVAPLGEGGMAAVYKAYQPEMERYVALKVLPRHFADDPEFIARFEREAKTMAQLQHPHILPVFDYGQSEGYTYIAMPLIQCGTLSDALKGKPLPLARIRQVVAQVGDALNYAHQRGLIHRDVKPSNVLIDEGGNCLLTDFGLARLAEATAGLTTTGTILGTPAYMSPEQGSGKAVDLRSDVYALGIILYQMATGRVPYKAETPVAVIMKHISDPLPLARTLNPELPEAVQLVILKALSKSPKDRYQTSGEMVRAIQAAIPEASSAVPRKSLRIRAGAVAPEAPAAGQPGRVRPVWSWALAGVAALAVAGVCFAVFGKGAHKRKPVAASPSMTSSQMSAQSPSSSVNRVAAAQPPVAAVEKSAADKGDLYMSVDLAAGPSATNYPVTYYRSLADVPGGVNSDAYKTTRLLMRRIPKGTFMMGSPVGELGRDNNGTQHQVTLSKDFYIGVFEVTQRQWERVMGDWPSFFNNPDRRDCRPVEKVSYNDIRGPDGGLNWPASDSVDVASFMGRLRARTGKLFDLPTEAQWEYACRAGTATALNSGKNLTDRESCSRMAELGRYRGNSGRSHQNADTSVGTAKVGSYLANAWDLYDMHGNVWEWCLDRFGVYPGSVSDPKGASSGSLRAVHSGSWQAFAWQCLSAYRDGMRTDRLDVGVGFRLVAALKQPHDGMEASAALTRPAVHVETVAGKQDLYLSVDLSGGPSARNYPVSTYATLADVPGGANSDAYKTTRLLLRRIPKGTFIMGSPVDELGREGDGAPETQHQVTLSQDFYLGVFEVTQRQWERVMGDWPSGFRNPGCRDSRPVENVSYNDIRGAGAGANWPASDGVDATSFMGQLRTKTGVVFDLPTESQWEYACRAGTTTALYSGKSLRSTKEDANMAELGRYKYNGGRDGNPAVNTDGGTAKVGSYLPNAWGLFDMYGNAREKCLDWGGTYPGTVVDPKGPPSGAERVDRGGVWDSDAARCRSADRHDIHPPLRYPFYGFRACAAIRVAKGTADGNQEQSALLKGASAMSSSVPPNNRVTAISEDLYLSVDLSAGPDATRYPVTTYKSLTDVPGGANSDTYKTTSLLLRRIPKGTFTMGSPVGETYRDSDEPQHQVTLTKDFYIGVFEVTQKQWERAMGTWPSYFTSVIYRDSRPVEQVTYNDIRGSAEGANWPASGNVDATSFMGKLTVRTGKAFDLPTESQWEYACRSGTKTSLYSGYNNTNKVSNEYTSEIARYAYNGGSGFTKEGDTSVGTAKVGSYLPNAWGLYDMLGNVSERCLDWYGTYPGATTDPKGVSSGSCRVVRGVGWRGHAWYIRVADRNGNTSPAGAFNDLGFRVALPQGP